MPERPARHVPEPSLETRVRQVTGVSTRIDLDASPCAADIGELSFVRTRCEAGAVKLWVGPAGTFTPFHYDSRNNVMFQIVGHKRVLLGPPYASEMMAQVSPWYAGRDPMTRDNPSCLPLATIELSPGDALFLPVGWWHAVEGLTPSITVTCIDFGLPNSYEKQATSLL